MDSFHLSVNRDDQLKNSHCILYVYIQFSVMTLFSFGLNWKRKKEKKMMPDYHSLEQWICNQLLIPNILASFTGLRE